jgi:hypothetical protein
MPVEALALEMFVALRQSVAAVLRQVNDHRRWTGGGVHCDIDLEARGR